MRRDKNRRILLVDDTEAIHADFRKVLLGNRAAPTDLVEHRSAFFGGDAPAAPTPRPCVFALDSAHQGAQALELVRRSLADQAPYALAFVDVRMPPGWDGVETIEHLWAEDPDLEVVICTAYSDYSGDQIAERLGQSDRLLVLKKPFDAVEVAQLAHALTEKWNTKRRLREQMRELENREQQARELAERLAGANERAQAASRAKSEFLANMSHEIRTPMTAILGHAEMLRDRGLPVADHAQHIEVIQSSGAHLLAILNDLLDLSKVEAGHMSVHIEPVSLSTLVREALSLMRSYALEKSLVLSAELATPIPAEIQSDPVRLRQILLNLLGNAVKFTVRGSVRIVLRMTGPTEAERLEIDVVDSGIGIPADHLPFLFEPFHQVDNSLTRQAGGTGIGLTITQRLAELLHGEVRVRSTPGQGSTFTVSLPLGDLTGVQRIRVLSDGPANATRPAASGSEPRLLGTVLLAEDTPVNQKLIATYLERAGATVTVVENGQQACDRVLEAQRAGRAFGIVLLDMQMPVVDGYQATRTLRAAGYTGAIVALTAHALMGDREKCIAAGCTEYVKKPVDRLELLRTCAALLQPPAPLPSRSPTGQDAGSRAG